MWNVPYNNERLPHLRNCDNQIENDKLDELLFSGILTFHRFHWWTGCGDTFVCETLRINFLCSHLGGLFVAWTRGWSNSHRVKYASICQISCILLSFVIGFDGDECRQCIFWSDIGYCALTFRCRCRPFEECWKCWQISERCENDHIAGSSNTLPLTMNPEENHHLDDNPEFVEESHPFQLIIQTEMGLAGYVQVSIPFTFVLVFELVPFDSFSATSICVRYNGRARVG